MILIIGVVAILSLELKKEMDKYPVQLKESVQRKWMLFKRKCLDIVSI